MVFQMIKKFNHINHRLALNDAGCCTYVFHTFSFYLSLIQIIYIFFFNTV